jgi:hypothetical protein
MQHTTGVSTMEQCKQHSGFEARIEKVEESIKMQWEVIDKIRNRPPAYVSIIYAILTFLLGCSVSYATLAIKIAEVINP